MELILRGDLKYTDDELLDGIKSKDTKVLQFILKENFKSIKQLVLLNHGDESDVNEILQESLIILYLKVREKKFLLKGSLKTYFYSIARLKWLKELRRRRKTIILTNESEYILDDSDSIEREIEEEIKHRIYREKFEELGEECKKVLKLFLLGTTIADITKMMGYSSEQHTRNQRFKCKKNLIQKINDTII